MRFASKGPENVFMLSSKKQKWSSLNVIAFKIDRKIPIELKSNSLKVYNDILDRIPLKTFQKS